MEPKENTGVLFFNKKLSEKHPDFTGSIFINGAKFNMAGWSNKSKNGTNYISLKLNPVANSTVEDFPPNTDEPMEEIF